MKSITVHWKDEITGFNRNMRIGVNDSGEGLFFDSEGPQGWVQKKGCGQFKARTPRDLIRKVRHLYSEPGVTRIVMIRGSADGWS